MDKNYITAKYRIKINDAVVRIGNTFNITTQGVGMAGGRATASATPSNDTAVVFANCLIEISKIVEKDYNHSYEQQKEVMKIIELEIKNELKTYNERRLNSELSKANFEAGCGDIIAIVIFCVIIMIIAYIFGAR